MNVLLMWMPGPIEIIVILLVGLLIFGRRLPEVGRSLGKSIVEFKKGIRDVESDMDISTRPSQRALPSDKSAPMPEAGPTEGEAEKPKVSSPE
jgi:sec-independent protein translocase protein TatA